MKNKQLDINEFDNLIKNINNNFVTIDKVDVINDEVEILADIEGAQNLTFIESGIKIEY